MNAAAQLELRARGWALRSGLAAAVRVAAIDALADVPLRPEEEVAMTRAVAKRRAEFRAGRHVAHMALDELGLDGPLPRRDDGAPGWPRGAVGSISHGGGLCTAFVLRDDAVIGCGVDVEDATGPLEPAVAGLILHPRDELPDAPVPARLALSAKEAAFKCVISLGLRAIDPREWSVRLAPDGSFVPTAAPAKVEPALAGRRFAGFWHVHAETVFAAAVVWRNASRCAAEPRGAPL
jgi:hypothetical protein